MTVKSILLLTTLVSSIFLFTQLITYRDFNDSLPSIPSFHYQTLHASKKNNLLVESIETFLRVCELTGISCILADVELLKKLQKDPQIPKALDDCKMFCKQQQTHVTFMHQQPVSGNHKFDTFVQHASSVGGFQLTKVVGEDERELSLEKRKTKKSLLYHLLLSKDGILIHLVLSYRRLGHHQWTNTCNFRGKRKSIASLQADRTTRSNLLENSPFCVTQRLLKSFQVTSTVIDGVRIRIPEHIEVFLDMVRWSHFTPCNFNNARNFVSLYGYEGSIESNEFRRKAKELLSLAVKILGGLGVRFWLSSGTCLGWFRQCDFIPHSKDVDIGIWITDYKPELVQGFLDAGLKLKHKFGKVEDSFELSFTLGDLKLDIFFFYEEGDSVMWNGGTQARTGRKFKYNFPRFSLCWSSLVGLTVRVPCPTKAYIMANYGENWNKLVKFWDWKASPPNVRENGEWRVEEREEVIQVY